MAENQNIEYKESWRDEHLKNICAFANTNGGTLFVGKDDNGNVVGVPNSKKLLDEIPNQIKNYLGFVAEVNVKKLEKKEFVAIKIKVSQSPISFKGKFYKRSGSTTQELNGNALQNFLLEKSNLNWEAAIEEGATVDDIDLKTIALFKDLAKSRFAVAVKETSVLGLLEKLHLSRGKKLKRAAILLFGKEPQKFYHSAYIKIGRFKSDASLLAMDEIKGNLFQQATDTLEILKKKYLHNDVTIEGLYREDQSEIPDGALREALVNAIVHKDYVEGVTQIKFYPGSVTIWNNGELSRKLTIDKLKKKHPSFPRNELIAETFYKAGLIEKWGYGTVKIIDECSNSGLPDPLFEEEAGGLQVTFLKDLLNEDYLRRRQLNDRQTNAVLYVKDYGKITNSEYQKLNSTSKRTATDDLKILSEKGLLIKIGATGKGTQYILQRGNKGAKRATEKSSGSSDELDEKILLLENQLSKVNPNDEVRWHFNKEIFYKIYDSWISELLVSLIPVAQKFNKLFNSPKHNIYVFNGIGQIQFIDDRPENVLKKLKESCRKYPDPIYDATLNLSLNYGTFRKGGLKTFSCNYGIEINFEMIKYIVSVDQFIQDGTVRSRVPKIERLLHQPVSKKEINNIATELGQAIFDHLEYNTKKAGIR